MCKKRFDLLDNADVSAIDWQDFNLNLGPDVGNWNDPATTTKPYALNLQNVKVRFKVEYESKAGPGFFPALNLVKLNVGEI